jgi:general secretion pathway protein K
MIFLLGVLIVQFTEKAMGEIAVEAHYADRERLRVTAYSALETTLAVLADVIAVDGGLTSPAQGWADPLGVAGFAPEEETRVTVSFSDESGKLPLNGVDEVTLGLMFDRMGLNRDDALHLSETLLDWIDEDDETRLDGAESDLYGEAEWPYHASNQPVRRLSELALVDGFREMFFDEAGRPNHLFTEFAANVSLYSDGQLNANSATEMALRAYGGYPDAAIDAWRRYLSGPDGIPGNADDRYFATNDEIALVLGESPIGAGLGAGITVLRIHVEVEFGISRFALEAVVQPGAAGGQTRAATPAPQPGGNQPNRSATEARISYPFVFLELTEDVGHNATIAASTTEPVVDWAIRTTSSRQQKP